MRHPERSIPVRVPGQKPFTVTAGEVAGRLIKSEVKAKPGEKGPNGAGADNDGRTITLYEDMLDQKGNSAGYFELVQERGLTHEGIHWTGHGPRPGDGARSATGERSVFDPGAMGVEPLRSAHQQPYWDAAGRLLAP
jgi:hypothetical protein